MRFALWTAVSSETQARKVSLDEQEKAGRAAAASRGWMESAGPFIVPGESRTRWVNLRDAEAAIPALREMLDSAQRREFDVLIVYSYDRLRELLDPVARTLAAYGAQIFSVGQPVEPQPPEEFDPYATDTANAVQLVSALTSRAEINAMRRRYRLGVPARVRDKGLHSVGLLPFGYRKLPGREKDPDVVPILEPEKAAVLIQAKDLFLSGSSIPQVTAWLNQTGLPPRRGGRWHVSSVRRMLANPFYAGRVQHGAIRRRRDPRTGKAKDTIVRDRSRILERKGQHEALWDEATYFAILAEYTRRARKFKGRKTARLSRLLYCGVCGASLHLTYLNSRHDDSHRAWYCRAVREHWHNFIRDSDALTRLASRIVSDLREQEERPLTEREDRTALLRAAVQDLDLRRDRLLDALEEGILDPLTYAERVQGIEQRLAAARRELESAERAAEDMAARSALRIEWAEAIEAIPGYLLQAPAQEVNTQLHQLIERIMVGADGTLQVWYR